MENIVVIDLGWGGLILANNVYKTKVMDVVFIRLPIFEYGMTIKEKVMKFDVYLQDIMKRFDPIEIIIACNSLSGLYSQTTFSKVFKIKVYDLVQIMCERITNEYVKGDKIIVFASKLTIQEKFYTEGLCKRGIYIEDIVNIPLVGWAKTIEEKMFCQVSVDIMKDVLYNKLQEYTCKGKTIVVLACTHFEYVQSVFLEVLESIGVDNLTLIDVKSDIVKALTQENTVKKKMYICSYKVRGNVSVKQNLKTYFHNPIIDWALDNEKVYYLTMN